MSILENEHDPNNYSGFTKFFLKIYKRFAKVGVDNHLDTGNLDGTGSNPDVHAHITSVTDTEHLYSHFDFPVIFTVPTGTSSDARTTAADTVELDFSVSAWVVDYGQQYGFTEAQVIVGNVVNNLEENRNLLNQDSRDPLAEDTTLNTTRFGPEPDTEIQYPLKYGTATFTVRTKRYIPHESAFV